MQHRKFHPDDIGQYRNPFFKSNRAFLKVVRQSKEAFKAYKERVLAASALDENGNSPASPAYTGNSPQSAAYREWRKEFQPDPDRPINDGKPIPLTKLLSPSWRRLETAEWPKLVRSSEDDTGIYAKHRETRTFGAMDFRPSLLFGLYPLNETKS